MTCFSDHKSLEEKLKLLADREKKDVSDIMQEAIDEYYMNHYETNKMDLLLQMSEKQIGYLQSIAILTNNYESIKEVNDSINDFMNN